MTTETNKQLTLGEKRCHVNFNPSSDDKIGTFKRMMADAIDFCEEERISGNGLSYSDFISMTVEQIDERDRCFEIAMEHLETAQMYAVKGIAKGLK
jgi:hypothetical protein